jgi:hypothetical protein
MERRLFGGAPAEDLDLELEEKRPLGENLVFIDGEGR